MNRAERHPEEPLAGPWKSHPRRMFRHKTMILAGDIMNGATYSRTRPTEIVIVWRARALGFESATQARVVRGVWRVSDRNGCVWHTLNHLAESQVSTQCGQPEAVPAIADSWAAGDSSGDAGPRVSDTPALIHTGVQS